MHAIKISALICTRNGSRTIARAAERCLAALQAWDPDGGELIVVDNGSTDGTTDIVEAIRGRASVPMVLLSAARRGKLHAFEVGVQVARAGIVCIVDDDNFVAPDYFRYLHDFFDAYPGVGIVGGLNELDPGVSAPPWFEWAKHMMACTRPFIGDDVRVDEHGRETGGCGWIAGAGMGLRKQPLLDALAAGYRFYNDTQRGAGMRVTGEDNELCLLYRSMGYRFGYDPRMRLDHSIAPERLELDAFWALCRSIGAGALGMDPFLFTTKRTTGRLPLRWTWQWQLVSKLRRLVELGFSTGPGEGSREERKFRRRIDYHNVMGAISRMVVDRGRYNGHIRLVAGGEWTRYRVR